MNSANICDIILIVGAVGFGVYGAWRGVLHQLGSVLAFLLGFLGARMFGSQMAAALNLNAVLSYIIVFMIVYIGVTVIFKVLRFTAKMLLMGPLDRFCGLLVGALKWFLFASIVLNLLYMIEPSWPIFHSKLTAWTIRFVPWLLGNIR